MFGTFDESKFNETTRKLRNFITDREINFNECKMRLHINDSSGNNSMTARTKVIKFGEKIHHFPQPRKLNILNARGKTREEGFQSRIFIDQNTLLRDKSTIFFSLNNTHVPSLKSRSILVSSEYKIDQSLLNSFNLFLLIHSKYLKMG